ncbi:MAG: glycosyl transferase, partial [Alphaproteobacteria bacterium]
LIEPGKTGWLVSPGDGYALADAIRQALSLTPGDRETLAMAARAHIASRHALDKMCDETLALYRSVLAQPANA